MSTVAIEQLASKIRFFFLSAEWEFRVMPLLRDRGDSIALDPFRPGAGERHVVLDEFGFMLLENKDAILFSDMRLMKESAFAAWWLKDATSEDPFEELLGHIRQGYEQKLAQSAKKPFDWGALAVGCVILLIILAGGWYFSAHPAARDYFTPMHHQRSIHP